MVIVDINGNSSRISNGYATGLLLDTAKQACNPQAKCEAIHYLDDGRAWFYECTDDTLVDYTYGALYVKSP